MVNFSSYSSASIIILIVYLVLPSSKCCLRKRHNRLKVQQDDKLVLIDEPLYTGDSVKEFLSLCKNVSKPKLSFDAAKKIWTMIDPAGITNCHHKSSNRKFHKLELYYVKDAQENLKEQIQQMNSLTGAGIGLLLFIIPLLMVIYLTVRGHFNIGTLPYIGHLFQSDKTDGVMNKQFVWMKFLILPGNHSEVRSRDPDKIKWYKYNKEDEKLDSKTINATISGPMKFKFRDRTNVAKFISDEELKAKKRNIVKIGWDFIADRRTFEPPTSNLNNTSTKDNK